MSDKIFLVNKLDHTVLLNGGYMEIVGGGYLEINKGQLNSDDITHMLNMGLVEVSLTRPAEPVKKEGVTFTVTQPYTGMTQEELLASKNEGASAEAATGTLLGQELVAETTTAEHDVKKPKTAKVK
jgi:hypothetical protein